MKNMRRIAGVFLGLVLVASSAMATMADSPKEGSVSMYLPAGDQATIRFNGNATSFFEFYDVIPGDTLVQNISIENQRSEAVSFYINAQDGSLREDLLREVGMKVVNTDTGRTLYNGNMTGKPVSIYGNDFYKNAINVNGINMGVYQAKATARLRVELTVPVEVDNTFADVLSRCVWQVRAELPDGSTGGSSSSSSSSSNRMSTVRDQDRGRDTTPDDLYRITDNDVPLAGEAYKIADNQIPLAELPKTGGLPLGFMGLAAVGAGGSVLLAGRKKEN